MNDLQGRDVVVTGGAGALGTAVVARWLARGATCHVPVISERELEHFPYAKDPRVRVTVGLDLAREADVVGFFAGIGALYASIHVAGGFGMAPFTETSAADFDHLVAMNGKTCFLCCREAVRAIRRAGGGGRIVNVAAKPALVPTGGMVAYSISKAMVANLTTSLAEELAAERIWVNAVVPSIMDTPANRASMPSAPFDAWPKVDEVAATIVFLASPENAVTRGALVPVYGAS